jgi:hypothetical protein
MVAPPYRTLDHPATSANLHRPPTQVKQRRLPRASLSPAVLATACVPMAGAAAPGPELEHACRTVIRVPAVENGKLRWLFCLLITV